MELWILKNLAGIRENEDFTSVAEKILESNKKESQVQKHQLALMIYRLN